MNHRPSIWQREFSFTDRDFRFLQELVNHRTGISLSDAKRELIYSRLTKRLRLLKIDSFSKYCQLLKNNIDGEEVIHFTNAVTTNLTSFFREPHHFDYFKNILLSNLTKSISSGNRIRFWSAGCSTGEEAYSLAICLEEVLPNLHSHDVKILATDLDSSVLETARHGKYPRERTEKIPRHFIRRCFKQENTDRTGLLVINPDIRRLITFRQLNLIHEWPMKGPFNAIFCRNVVIYFDKPTQRVLIDRFANMLPTGGLLFLGHSESLFKVTNRFELVGQTIYRKIQ